MGNARTPGALDFVAVDWGTSRLRAWGLAGDGTVLAQAASDEGMRGLERDGYEPALFRLIGDWLPEGLPALLLGPEGLAALRAVLPAGTQVYAVGGVGADSFAAWLRAGADGFGIGSALYRPGDDAGKVAGAARALVAAFDRETGA